MYPSCRKTDGHQAEARFGRDLISYHYQNSGKGCVAMVGKVE